VLLNLNADPALNFEFMDGGAIRFQLPTDDLARCDFTRATAIGDPE
jgi:hypothetical protein